MCANKIFKQIRSLRFLCVVLVPLAAVGCAFSTPVEPIRPALTTTDQSQCANVCEVIHACSGRACSDFRVLARWTPDTSACAHASHSILEDCYTTCADVISINALAKQELADDVLSALSQ